MLMHGGWACVVRAHNAVRMAHLGGKLLADTVGSFGDDVASRGGCGCGSFRGERPRFRSIFEHKPVCTGAACGYVARAGNREQVAGAYVEFVQVVVGVIQGWISDFLECLLYTRLLELLCIVVHLHTSGPLVVWR